MQEIVIGIIRIDSKNLVEIPHDEKRFIRAGLEKISLQIPRVKVLSGTGYKKEKYEDRPLLLNYGFIFLPLKYARDRETLIQITRISSVIGSFVYRRDGAIQSEKEELELEGLIGYKPVIIEQICPKEAARLEAVSHNLNVYEGLEGLTVGSIVLLQGYPFKNMAAKIVGKSISKITVELLDTGYKATIEPAHIYYKNT